MIFTSSIHFLRTGLFLIPIFSAAAELPGASCDRAIYGQPIYSQCIALLYGSPTHHVAGISNIDNDEHGFLLPYFGASGQFTINQWRHRVDLPEVWYNNECKIALLVKSVPLGGFTTDSGSWENIASRGKELVDYCLSASRRSVQSTRSGGVGNAGTHGKLNIVVYSWRSAFDRAITSGIKPDGLVGGVDWNETMARSSASGQSRNLTAAAYDAVQNLTNGQIPQIARDFERGLMSK